MTNLLKLLANALGLTEKEMKIRQAIHELQALSDKDLDDLGIARRNIEDAVRHGRKNNNSHVF